MYHLGKKYKHLKQRQMERADLLLIVVELLVETSMSNSRAGCSLTACYGNARWTLLPDGENDVVWHLCITVVGILSSCVKTMFRDGCSSVLLTFKNIHVQWYLHGSCPRNIELLVCVIEDDMP